MTGPSTPLPEVIDALLAELSAHIERAEEGHQIYHAAAVSAGKVIEKLRAAGLSWRDIDKRTVGIAPSSAAKWMKLAAGQGGPYVRAGRDAPDDRDSTASQR